MNKATIINYPYSQLWPGPRFARSPQIFHSHNETISTYPFDRLYALKPKNPV